MGINNFQDLVFLEQYKAHVEQYKAYVRRVDALREAIAEVHSENREPSTEQPTCPKCESTNIRQRWHRSDRPFIGPANCSTTNVATESLEHIHMYCETCSYDWIGKVFSDQPSTSQPPTKTDEQVVEECDELAIILAEMCGWEFFDSVTKENFHNCENPHAQHYWKLAVAAYEHITSSCVQTALANLEEES